MAEYFSATCERCGETETTETGDIRADGAFVCSTCRAKKPVPNRPRKRAIDHARRRAGCIVTTEAPDGKLASHHEAGKTDDALRAIAESLPAGHTIVCISTWRTVLGDVRGESRRDGRGNIDPYRAERAMLGRIGRLDLLTERAGPLYVHNASHAKEARSRRTRRAA